MLLTHIVNLHAGQRTIRKCFLNRQTRIIGVYMYLYNIIISYYYNAVTDLLQIFLKLTLDYIFAAFQHNDKFRTITKADILFFRSADRSIDHAGCCTCIHCEIRCLTLQGIERTANKCHQTFPARINNSRLLQYRQQFRCLQQCFLHFSSDFIAEFDNIVRISVH